jgi:hypothetical protein
MNRPWLVRFAGALLLSVSSIAVAAEPDDADQTPEPAAEPPAAAPKPAEPAPASPPPAKEAAAAPAPGSWLEHMGPDTFPGRLRGLYGGSLWLEPDFQGLQWPQNTHTGLGLSANVWIDTGYETIKRGLLFPNTALYLQQGRGVLRATPAYVHDRFFIQGQIEAVGNMCQAANAVCVNSGTFTTDDLSIRIGEWNSWDVRAGRFEGWEVYHLGMGMEPYTLERFGAGMFGIQSQPVLDAPTFYGVSYLQYRPSNGLAIGDIAFHAYPTEFLRIELLARLGTDNDAGGSDTSTGGPPSNYLGGRPVAILDLGWFKLRVGAEYQKITPTTQTITPGTPQIKVDPVALRTQKGAGASVQFVLDPWIEFGLNGAVASQYDGNAFGQQVNETTFTTKSVGGFVNFRPVDPWLVGLGINYTSQLDKNVAANSSVADFTSQLQGFVALQYLLAGQLFIKGDFALARAYFQPSDPTSATWTNNMYTGRIRLLYLF